MALAETLFLGLGLGIAKGALRLWLKDHEVALGTATSAAEIASQLMKSGIANWRSKNAAARLVEQIAEKVSEDFDAEIETAFPRIPRERAEVVARNAGTAISEAEITPTLLAKHNLDPTHLSIYFLMLTGAEGGHPRLAQGEDEDSRLYQHLIMEASQRIIEIAGILPGFTVQTFAEVLKREREILDRLDTMFSELARIQSGRQLGDHQIRRIESIYRRACVMQFDYLQLFGVDLDAASQRYSLSVAYVSLTLSDIAEIHEPDEAPTDTYDIAEALSGNRLMIVRGPAGAGKTTLVQWVIVSCAGKRFSDSHKELNERVPFLVRLRQFIDKELPPLSTLGDITVPAYASEAVQNWTNEQLRKGTAVVLIDGLDEFPKERHHEVATWISNLREFNEEGQIMCILTTRPHACREGWLDECGFTDITIDTMSNVQVGEFIDHWHDAIAKNVGSKTESSREKQSADNLKRLIATRRSLSLLAATPMLCALICALHRKRREEIPDNISELYTACFELFFRRDPERKIAGLAYPSIVETHMWLLLRDLGCEMLRSGRSEINVYDCDACFDRRIPSLQNPGVTCTGSEVRRLFVERVGILAVPAEGIVSFPHRSFLEFLAALEVGGSISIAEVVNNIYREGWREVASLCGLTLSEEQSTQLVEQLLSLVLEDRSLVFVAAAIVNSMPSRSPDSLIAGQVSEELRAALPPKRVSDVDDLVTAGNLVIRHMRAISEYSVTEAAACIRLLTRIGTPEAYELLDGAVADGRIGVHRSLIQSFVWASDLGEFAGRFLRRVKGVLFCYPQEAVFIDGIGVVALPINWRFIRACKTFQCVGVASRFFGTLVGDIWECPELQEIIVFVRPSAEKNTLELIDRVRNSARGVDVSAVEAGQEMATFRERMFARFPAD